ncbi:hypothetical protein DGG96_20045 [Legionella qingyii]|uniref:Uncharacterized protein n=1 Tax=Legionella qingyii TaxID=2184757 RepID=A0A317TWX3_9GAMM|nr:hypothetical protein [Legionella qingyii]PWY53871.1 hypothetical protein DGG96_20045 [Legionella qingyii]RUR21143.1 hypothetical protein ELY20_13600 [Legionella qingyii]RUR22113.1 hypothetical protein ELY16_15440 [Legionella qingyii]
MTQRIILKKFIKFLEITEIQLIKELQEEFPKNYQDKVTAIQKDLYDLRTALKKGHCLGFSVIDGAMDHIGKLKWWDHAKAAVANWDEQESTLDKLIELPGSEEDSFWQTKKEKEQQSLQSPPIDKKKIKLKTLFNRLLPYVISNHACFDKNFKTSNLNQYTLLSPTEHHFEILSKQGIVKKIQQRKITAGKLTTNELIRLLNENDFTDTIAIINSPTHTIRVSFKNGSWSVYNSNYDQTSPATCRKYFPNKLVAVNEVFRILGQSIAIVIASTNSEKKISLPLLSTLKPFEMLDRLTEDGLFIIAKWCPDILQNVLEQVENLPSAGEVIAQGLLCQSNGTGLQCIAKSVPGALPKALELAAKAKNGDKLIVQALLTQDEDKEIGLKTILFYAPASLELALDKATQTLNDCELITQALLSKDDEDWSALHYIAADFPELLPRVFSLFNKTANGPQQLAKCILEKNKHNSTLLYLVARYSPNSLSQTLDIASKWNVHDPEPLAKEIVNNLKVIAQYAPPTLSKALNMALKAPNGSTLIKEALLAKNEKGLRIIKRYSPDCLDQVQQIIQNNPSKSIKYQGSPQIVRTNLSFWERNQVSATILTATVVGVTAWFATKK